MDAFIRRTMIFLIGGFGYYSLEVLYRGYSHWTMFLTGGIAFLCLFSLFTSSFSLPFWARCVAGALIVTGIEFVAGIIVNKWMGWYIWDYSRQPFNLGGQICLLFSMIWLILCIPIGFFSRLLNQKVFNKLMFPLRHSLKNKDF
ncbi:MAG: hypothetical protein EOM28_02400 [Clostridia bacterium]|nr:hypothetical protein [Anaerotignum sp.]NCC15192.1 hypothetical protein [Clostridia bacterium]